MTEIKNASDLENGSTDEVTDEAVKTNEVKPNRKRLVIISAAAILSAILIIVSLFVTHVICFHDWVEATCENPKTCLICEKTQGESLGHEVEEWEVVQNSTCSAEGQEQTQCARCAQMITNSIPKLAHSEGDWVITKDVKIESNGDVVPGEEGKKCIECGELLESREYTIELTLSQENALKSANSLNYMHLSYEGMIDWLREFEGYSLSDAKFAAKYCGQDWDENAVKAAKVQMQSGSSKKGLQQYLTYEKFTDKQIEYALESVGY